MLRNLALFRRFAGTGRSAERGREAGAAGGPPARSVADVGARHLGTPRGAGAAEGRPERTGRAPGSRPDPDDDTAETRPDRPRQQPAGRPARPAPSGSPLRAWAELLRLPALFTVPGDALAGAAAVSARPGPRTLLAIGSSLCLYEAGMALNDWADRDEDALERPHRPLPSGRIRPSAALAAAGAATAAGLALAARAGRPALAVATSLAATVWAYDLVLKRTPAGPAAMAAARGLDLLLGAAATRATPDAVRGALPSAALLSSHTLAVTAVSRRETTGGSPLAPLAALATTVALALPLTRSRPGPAPSASPPTAADAVVVGGGRERAVTRLRAAAGAAAALVPPPLAPDATVLGGLREPGSPRRPAGRGDAATPGPSGTSPPTSGRATGAVSEVLRAALGTAYAVTAGRPYFHAALNPSPQLTQRAVGGGIRATIPLQAALCARAGAPVGALLTATLAPLARRFAKKVSVT
ncbi:SCO3242 family prenyltransferase [Streptomyces sp. NPDC056161]|uniref:SCO3242 family prenyltransferase n=1 Tax=Streptomyces sp. NPDC056161 TaxID=3345732 RepID=UPI0035D58553